MRKFKLLLALLAIGNWINAQTLVVTTPQAKNVVLEEFTGIHCGYCPDGHARAQALSDANPGRVVLVNVHAGGYAVPQAGEPDFRTIYGEALDSQAQVSGYPAGTVNRHIFNDIDASKTSMSRGSWAYAASQVFPLQSPVNVGFESTFDSATRELTVNVEVYYTKDSPKSTNYLNVVFLENHVIGYQSDYGNGTTNTYDHKHILREMITGQWGDQISTTTKGSLVSKTYKYTVPVDFVIENCDVAVYLAESHQEIYTGVMDKAINGKNDGTTVAYIGDLMTSNEIVKKSVASSNVSFDISAISALINSEDFKFTLTSEAPNDWTSGFNIDGTNYTTTATVNLSSGTSNDIKINVLPGLTAGVGKFILTMESVNIQASTKEMTVYVVSGVTDLIVNNSSSWGDGSDTMASLFADRFKAGLTYANNSTFGELTSDVYMMAEEANTLDDIKNIYYNVGWSFPSLSDELVGVFEKFLDNGGNLMISGQDVGWDNFDANGYGSETTKSFILDYMQTNFVDDGNTSNSSLSNVTDDDIYKNISSSPIINVYGKSTDNTPYFYPDQLKAESNGKAVLVYNNNTSKPAAIRNNADGFKTFYLGVSLEMIKEESVRNQIMKITYDWFNGDITSEVFDHKMNELNCYPNPTSSTVTISFDNTLTGFMKVYDLSGNFIEGTQINTQNEVNIDVSSFANGQYFYTIENMGVKLFGKFQVLK